MDPTRLRMLMNQLLMLIEFHCHFVVRRLASAAMSMYGRVFEPITLNTTVRLRCNKEIEGTQATIHRYR